MWPSSVHPVMARRTLARGGQPGLCTKVRAIGNEKNSYMYVCVVCGQSSGSEPRGVDLPSAFTSLASVFSSGKWE